MGTNSFAGQVALVTGAASGIGRAAAQAFAAEGARVAVCDVDAAKGEETVAAIKAAGGEAMFVAVDVANAASVETMVERIVAAYGRLDVAFNNAGINLENAPFPEWDEAVFDRTMSINSKGVMLCMKYEARQMLKQGKGAIVNTASVESFKGVPGHTGYAGSKHAVLGMTRCAALEFAKRGIRVNAVCPGVTRTPLIESVVAAYGMEALAGFHPMGRICEPEDIANAVLFLNSDKASMITGHALPVDGGMLA